MANYDRAEHIIEFVFRTESNMTQDELDSFIGHASEELFPDYRDEAPEDYPYAIYIPEGSHWRCIDIDPPASSLPGGNRLAVDDDPHYELDIVSTALATSGRVYCVEKGQRTLIGSTGFAMGRDSVRTQAKMIAKRHRHGNAAHTERIELD